MDYKILIDQDSLSRIIKRISHEIIEKNKGTKDLIFFGVLRRGFPLAKRLSKNIEAFEGEVIPCFHLDISGYRDDIKVENILVSDCDIDINNKTVILVDDVISTGRTVRAAMDAISDLGRPARIELVSIVDRGHRELPIKPDFIGKNIPTSKEEEVELNLLEVDGVDQVYIK